MLLLTESSEGFFNGDISTVANKTPNRLNLRCYYYGNVETNSEYCSYQYYSNGSSSKIEYDYMKVTSIYKNIAKRCTGFTDTTDIGFGLCSPLEFDSSDISILCTCATDMCNVNFTSCKSSVTNQLETNSAPPVLTSMIPELNTQVSCYDTSDSSNASYYCASFVSPFIDIQKCNEYTRSHTVLCMYSLSEDEPFTAALTTDIYTFYLSGALSRVYQYNQESSTTLFYNETLTSFYIKYILRYMDGNNTVELNMQRCFCTENYCNYNLTTCLASYRRTTTTMVIPIGNSIRKVPNNIIVFICLYFIIKLFSLSNLSI